MHAGSSIAKEEPARCHIGAPGKSKAFACRAVEEQGSQRFTLAKKAINT